MCINNDHLYYTSCHGLNWQFLLLNQWMNYGMLCACITINPKIIEKKPFLHNTSNNDYCLSKVTMLLDQFQSDCNLTREDRDSLVCLCIQNFYEVSLITLKFYLKMHWREVGQNSHEKSVYLISLRNQVFWLMHLILLRKCRSNMTFLRNRNYQFFLNMREFFIMMYFYLHGNHWR